MVHPISTLSQLSEVLSDSDLTLLSILVPRNFSFNSSLIRVVKTRNVRLFAVDVNTISRVTVEDIVEVIWGFILETKKPGAFQGQ